MDAVMGLLNNPLVLAGFGLLVKFAPGIRGFVANSLIGPITVILAWLSQVAGPTEAHAFAGPIALNIGAFGLTGAFGGIGAALWQAAQAFLLNEVVLRHLTPKRPPDSKQHWK